MKKAVVIFSGGLDSTTCLALAKAEGFACYALSFDYGQRHRVELTAAKKIAQAMNVAEHKIMSLPMHQIGGSALTDLTIAVPEYKAGAEIPVTYVPARNTIFLSMALGYAEMLDAHDIYIGVSTIEYSNYSDCRPEFIQAFQETANLATKAGIEGNGFKFHAPLMYLSKAETIQLGLSLGVDYSMTITCYQATAEGESCGYCHSCALRKKGFKDLGINDPIHYKNN